MKKQILRCFLIVVLFFGFILPTLSASAAGGYYTFRSTVAGTGINTINNNKYEINNETYDFYQGETIYALTRIFNITNVKTFQFKHEIVRNGFNRTGESPVFSPNRHWWQETYYWFPFENIPAGDYDLVSYIRQDGENYRRLAVKHITVTSQGYDRNRNFNYSCNNGYDCPRGYEFDRNMRRGQFKNVAYNRRLVPDPEYTFDWTKTGLGINNTGGQSYDITGEKSSFNSRENIYALTKFSNILNVQKFKVKHEVYRNGIYSKTDETPEMAPNNALWKESYIRVNLGNLSEGSYEIKISISVNGGSYKYLFTKGIKVYNYYGCNDSRCYDYKYNWSQTDNDIRQISNYAYDTINPKSNFNADERVMVLTKLGNIRGIEKFKIRHELYLNYSLVRTNDSDERWPRYDSWDYNYFWTDFGRLSSGSYMIKVYISVNGGSYVNLDSKSINVSNNYNPYNPNYPESPNYNYNGTQIGTVDNYRNYQPINYYN